MIKFLIAISTTQTTTMITILILSSSFLGLVPKLHKHHQYVLFLLAMNEDHVRTCISLSHTFFAGMVLHTNQLPNRYIHKYTKQNKIQAKTNLWINIIKVLPWRSFHSWLGLEWNCPDHDYMVQCRQCCSDEWSYPVDPLKLNKR